MQKIILASGSPRRKELLDQMGISFSVVVNDVDETIDPVLSPEDIVQQLALKKAKAACATKINNALIIGADTLVVQNDTILGKPKDAQEAFSMLTMLQGKQHLVYTGIAVISTGVDGDILSENIGVEVTEVYMRLATDHELWQYIDTQEPMDKAGAYGIQGKGAIFIQKIHGDYSSVVGLPIVRLYEMLKKQGFSTFTL